MCGGVLVVLGFGDCDCIGDGIDVVGVESKLGSREVGLDGVGDTGVLLVVFGSAGCESWLLQHQLICPVAQCIYVRVPYSM